MDIEITVKLLVKNAIDPEALREDFHNDPLEFIRYLVQEEGLMGCVEDDFEITNAQVASEQK